MMDEEDRVGRALQLVEEGLEDKLAFTVADVARLLSVSKPTVYRSIQLGELKAIKVLTRTLVLRPDLDDFLKSREPAA
jgi:excisionase family DNA binding protein